MSRRRIPSRLVALFMVLALVVALGSSSPASVAAYPPGTTLTGVAYSQSFDGLSATGTGNTLLPDGWFINEEGTSASNDETYRAGAGADIAGDTYSFGAAAASDRALGTLRSSTLIPTFGVMFTNSAGVTFTSLDIAFTGEQWRLGQNTASRLADRLDFQYSLDATSLTTGAWTDVDALDFASPVLAGTVGALDGNAAANRTAVSASISSLSIANGASFWLRWVDPDLTPGSDDGLAIDDFSLTPQGSAGDTAPTVSSTTPANGATGLAVNADMTVTFSEPVNTSGSWFTLSCASSGAHTATVSGGPTVFTLNPDTDFVNGELCTVTVVGASVSDQDAADPPDTMAADHVVTFTTVVACGAPATFIHDIQGTGATSPISGTNNITIEGIVTGDYQGAGGFSGFFVQEESADWDADAATSEGIFVFNTSFAANVGDKVRLTGNVVEYLSSGTFLTELSGISNPVLCGAGYGIAVTQVTLPMASVSDWERYEGMAVMLPQELTVSETYTLGRYGDVTLSSGGRLLNPTSIAAPGAPALAQQALNDRNRILLDDGNNNQNIDPTIYPAGGLSFANTLRSGYTVTGLTGVLEQRFGLYRIQPLPGGANFAAGNPRPVAPGAVGGNLQVAAFNMLNYFNGDGLGGGFPTARGATTAAEFTRQRDKIINAIIGLDADILGLMEIENDAPGYSAIQDLVAGLNASGGPDTYSFINTGVIGTDEIRVGLIYKANIVFPSGSYAVLTSAVNPLFDETRNRPALAQTFALNSGGSKLTVVVNHLKSKGSACAGDPDLGDGQGNCNITRTNAATALTQWLATDPTGSGDPDYLIIGDLNAYAKEDPITVFTNAGYTNLIDSYLGANAYSYVFGAQSGYLDHALANASLAAQVTGVAEWHINADEPIALDYNVEFKSVNHQTTLYSPLPYRSSDHDPVLVGIQLNRAPTIGPVGPFSVVEGGSTTLTATGSDLDGDTLSYAWDLDNNGTFETPGQSVTFSAAGLDGPSSVTVAVKVTDPSGATGSATATVDILEAATTLTLVPATQTVQYSDPINAVLLAAADSVSDLTPITVTTQWKVGAGAFSAGLPANLALAANACTGAGCSWTLAGNALVAPGVYTVRLNVTYKTGATDFRDATITVLKEDARLALTSKVLNTGYRSLGRVTLTVSVTDISATAAAAGDTTAGDIRTATVTFVVRDTNTAIGGCSLAPVTSSDGVHGTATCSWLPQVFGEGGAFTVGMIVNGNYGRNLSTDNVVITIVRAIGGKYLAGAGNLVLTAPQGSLAGDVGSRNDFGFFVRYNAARTVTAGSFNTIFRRTETDGIEHVYQMKGTAFNSMNNSPANCPGATPAAPCAANFVAKGILRDITDIRNPVVVQNGALIQILMTDRGEPGDLDSAAVTIHDRNGNLLFASNWSGTKGVKQPLAAGNILVR